MSLTAVWSLQRGIIDEDLSYEQELPGMREHIHAVIGFRLAEARSHAKMSQQKLAFLLGVHRNTVSRWEAGTGEIDAASLYIACCVLDISPVVLLKLVTMPPRSENA